MTSAPHLASGVRAILDSRQLLAVVVLARAGSFTLAGKKLLLTQSAVSHAIKALETELRCALFERTGRGVTLTPNGRKFLAFAEQILAAMESARAAIDPDVAAVSPAHERSLKLANPPAAGQNCSLGQRAS